MKYTFFAAVAEARKGHIIKSSRIVDLIWNKEKQALVLKHNRDYIFEPCIMAELLDKEEWEVIKEKHDIKWAAEQMDKGEKVRRNAWVNKSFYIRRNDYRDIIRPDGQTWRSNTEDLFENDWELA